MKIQSLSNDEVFSTLLSSPQGIPTTEATRRRGEYGSNEIHETHGRPMILRLASHFSHFLALLLWFAAGLCFLSEYLHPGEGLLRLGIAILAVIFINAIFTFIQEYRTEKAMEELRKMLPAKVAVIREGVEIEVDAAEIVPGDLVTLREGDKVPTDIRVVASSRLTVNNAPLTGESDSRTLSADPCDKELLESANLAFAGTLVVGGSGQACLCDRYGHRVRQNRPDNRQGGGRDQPAPYRNNQGQPHRCGHCRGWRRRFFPDRFFGGKGLLGQLSLCHRHHYRLRSRRAAAGRDLGTGHGE